MKKEVNRSVDHREPYQINYIIKYDNNDLFDQEVFLCLFDESTPEPSLITYEFSGGTGRLAKSLLVTSKIVS